MTQATLVVCRTCGVEHLEPAGVCTICADERQWVPEGGQAWVTLADLQADGRQVHFEELEAGLVGVSAVPEFGIGQQSKLVVTSHGSLLWDPIGYLDDAAVERVRAFGPVAAVAASHPHMFGLQVEWSRRLGGVPVLVSEPDLAWVRRPDPAIRAWSDRLELVPGVTLVQVGGHFPGSAVVHLATADGKGALLSSDTVFVNPDRASVSFMRSYPNHLPLSAGAVDRIVATLDSLRYDRIYGNFTNRIRADGRAVVHRSSERHRAWVAGARDGDT